MPSSDMFRRVAVLRTDISEQIVAPIFEAERISELGRTLAITSDRSTQRASVAIS
jgi:hypothetical protein